MSNSGFPGPQLDVGSKTEKQNTVVGSTKIKQKYNKIKKDKPIHVPRATINQTGAIKPTYNFHICCAKVNRVFGIY